MSVIFVFCCSVVWLIVRDIPPLFGDTSIVDDNGGRYKVLFCINDELIIGIRYESYCGTSR